MPLLFLIKIQNLFTSAFINYQGAIYISSAQQVRASQIMDWLFYRKLGQQPSNQESYRAPGLNVNVSIFLPEI